ncbi:MAG: hypothetical protein ACSNEK_09860 [Parachlamydiaceae bacterium]
MAISPPSYFNRPAQSFYGFATPTGTRGEYLIATYISKKDHNKGEPKAKKAREVVVFNYLTHDVPAKEVKKIFESRRFTLLRYKAGDSSVHVIVDPKWYKKLVDPPKQFVFFIKGDNLGELVEGDTSCSTFSPDEFSEEETYYKFLFRIK